MATPTSYEYDVATECDDNDGKVNLALLASAIRSSSIVTAFDRIDVDGGITNSDGIQVGGTLKIWFKDVLSQDDENTLLALVQGSSAAVVDAKKSVSIDAVGEDAKYPLSVVQNVLKGRDRHFSTHDFCDPTTWYSESLRVTDEVASEVDGTTFQLAHTNVIDMTHGKVYKEDTVAYNRAPTHQFSVVVKVNDVEKTMDTPFGTLGDGDYSVNYADGKILFNDSQTGNTVKVSYSYATTSLFKVIPPSGKVLEIVKNVATVSVPMAFKDNFVFSLVRDGTIMGQTVYKSWNNALQEVFDISEQIPDDLAGSTPRSFDGPRRFMSFAYLAARELRSSDLAEFWIYLENDVPFEGHLSMAFKALVEDES